MNEPNDISNKLRTTIYYSIFTDTSDVSVSADITNNSFDYKYDYAGKTVDSISYPSMANLKTVIIGSGITELTVYCFQGATNLESIDFTNATGLIKIKTYALQNCSQLQSVIFGSSNVALSNYIFQGCNNLSNITFNSNSQLTSSSFSYYTFDLTNSNSINITIGNELASTLGVTSSSTSFYGAGPSNNLSICLLYTSAAADE